MIRTLLFSSLFLLVNLLNGQWVDQGSTIETSDDVIVGTTGDKIRISGAGQYINFIDATHNNITLGHAQTSNKLLLRYGGLDILNGSLYVNSTGTFKNHMLIDGTGGNTLRIDGNGQLINFIDGTHNNITLGHAGTANNLELRYGGLNILNGGVTVSGNSVLTGNVMIGTTTYGTHKLAVEGSIGAREVKVESSGWSDFVFKNNYKLRTLEEVDKFISQNGHLPEIPSEAEVQKNGINLGEMDSKLLQKIEELTLYLIEQNKKIESMEKELKELRKKGE